MALGEEPLRVVDPNVDTPTGPRAAAQQHRRAAQSHDRAADAHSEAAAQGVGDFFEHEFAAVEHRTAGECEYRAAAEALHPATHREKRVGYRDAPTTVRKVK